MSGRVGIRSKARTDSCQQCHCSKPQQQHVAPQIDRCPAGWASETPAKTAALVWRSWFFAFALATVRWRTFSFALTFAARPSHQFRCRKDAVLIVIEDCELVLCHVRQHQLHLGNIKAAITVLIQDIEIAQ